MSQFERPLLIVEDNEVDRRLLSLGLQLSGYANLTFAADGEQALALLAHTPFDLVLLDIMMPKVDGPQVLERMRADIRLRHVPVIMTSAQDEIDSVVRCIELGAEDYLPKPFNPTLLRARVGACLEKKRMRDELVQHARRMEKELEAARAIQLSMVPTDFPPATAARPLAVYGKLQQAFEVGGDLYDCFWIQPGRMAMLVADISDKGAAAALFMARTRTTIRLLAMRMARGLKPGATVSVTELITAANDELARDNSLAMFATLFFAIADTATGDLEWCNAGHALPWLVHRDGAVATLPFSRSLPLGLRPTIPLASGTLQLAPGESLFAFTDGITEATNADDEFFGDERLKAALAAAAGAEPAAMVESVLAAVRAFAAGAPPSDDMAALACRWRS